jgi:hypothetical protein
MADTEGPVPSMFTLYLFFCFSVPILALKNDPSLFHFNIHPLLRAFTERLHPFQCGRHGGFFKSTVLIIFRMQVKEPFTIWKRLPHPRSKRFMVLIEKAKRVA